MQKPPRLPAVETGAVRLLYLCFFKRSRNYLRGFLIAACAGAKITGFLLSRNIISFSVEPVALFSQAPRMRGKELNTVLFIVSDGITPAYAGKSQRRRFPRLTQRDHPRVCGEKPIAKQVKSGVVGSPPRMRGKAHTALPSSLHRKDHPRVCGEKAAQGEYAVRQTGSPPRMRGKVCLLKVFFSLFGITPAYAGKRKLLDEIWRTKRDHPRVCGEKPQDYIGYQLAAGSPPRMRGKD